MSGEENAQNERMPELIDPEELVLPVIRIGNSVRFDESYDELKFIGEIALSLDMSGGNRIDHYIWDASDRCFQIVNIVKIKRAPFWIRLIGASDLIIANYQLQLLNEIPKTWKRAYSDLSGLALWYADETGISKYSARASLHKCDSSLKLVDCMKTHLRGRRIDGY